MSGNLANQLAEIAELDVSSGENELVLKAHGSWIAASVSEIDRRLRVLEQGFSARADISTMTLDLSALERMDTYGAWLIRRVYDEWVSGGKRAAILTDKEDYQVLLKAVSAPEPEHVDRKRQAPLIRMLNQIGKTVYSFNRDLGLSLNLVGSAVRGPQLKQGKHGGVRFAAIAFQIDRMGIRAIPIIALMSFLIGAIIAQQGAFQLRYFGAEIFVVDMSAILILREIGVLLTAIMVAGRSGSAMTAELGSMKMREEVDALEVIGLNPVGVLVFPRLVALTIVVPCLTFIANLTAILGAMVVTFLYSGIGFEIFVDRMRDAVDLSTIFSGLIKAPFMAFIIGTISAVEGMKVEGSAESMGRRTTAAVVKSIFFVILLDGMFAIFYAQIGY